MSPAPDNSAFSPKRAALHTGVAAVIAIVALAAIAALADVKDPRRMGEGAGMFVAFLAALVFGISWLAQTGRRRAAWAVGVGFTVLVALAIIVTVANTPRRWVTEADRAPLVERADGETRRLVNPSLGFSLLAPGEGFVASTQVAKMFGEDPDRPTWGWLNQLDGAALVVTIEPGLGPDAAPSDVEELVSGMVEGIRLEVGRRDVNWKGDRPTFALEGTVMDRRVHVTGLGARLGAEGHEAIVIVMSIGDESGALDDVHGSVTLTR